MKPPEYFDLEPFNKAFIDFTKVNVEERAKFRKAVESKKKEVIMLFCNDDGEMEKGRNKDLGELG